MVAERPEPTSLPDSPAPVPEDLELQATALLADLPLHQRRGILLPHQERLRRQRETALPPVVAAAPGMDPARILDQWARRDELLSEAQLSDKERATLLMWVNHGYTDEQIADFFGCRRETVRGRRQAAMAKVAQVVEARLGDKERTTLLLWVNHGYTDDQIAELFGCRRETARGRRQAAMAKVAQVLQSAAA